MDVLAAALIGFGLLEFLNVFLLYFAPGTRRGNAVGVFRAYAKSKQDPEVHALVTYLVNWVAGTKLIFVALLIGIVIVGNSATRVFSVVALIFSILTFFWRLYPAIRAMDEEGQIEPRGYSRSLGIMVGGFVAVFGIVLAVYLWNHVR